MNIQTLSLTVGITTCYGDISILDTIKSVRNSERVAFDFILIADRMPLSSEIKKELKKYNVQYFENKTESSQTRKQKQILDMIKTDLFILTQDDVLLDSNALYKVVEKFTNKPELTMISIRNHPVRPTTFFEALLNIGTEIANDTAKKWKKGDNYLSVIGRFMAFRTETFKKFRLNHESASTDAYYYFENKRLGGKYEYMPKINVYFKNPLNMKEHLRKSSRFQYSEYEMQHYFPHIENEYAVPKKIIFEVLLKHILKDPVHTSFYFLVFLYTKLMKMKPASVLNPVWEVDVSTKKIAV